MLFAGGCLSQPVTITGPLQDGMHIWKGEVRIAGDVEIPAGAEVVVRPGTQIVFMPAGDNDLYTGHPHFQGSELIVRGRFVAEGSPRQPIEFRYVDAKGDAGSWGGLNLMASPWSSFAYCLFTQADSAIHSQESTVVIEESIFERNQVGIRFHSSQILIEHNRLRQNDTAIRFHFGAPVICHNLIEGNRKGLFITSAPEDFLIRHNLFTRNNPYHVVLGETVAGDVDLRNNRWLDSSSSGFLDHFFDHQRDSALGTVLLTPFSLSAGTPAGPSWNR